MQIRDELIWLNVLTVLLILAIIVFPSNPARVVLGIPFTLFTPGYVLTVALFPRAGVIGNSERLALAFGFSLCILPLLGLGLNFTPWGILLVPMLIAIGVFIVAISAVAMHRRRQLPEANRFTVSFKLSLPSWREQTIFDKVLSVSLILAVVGATTVAGIAMTKPKAGSNLTEFYVLDTASTADDYPKELTLGEEGRVVLGITNSEHSVMNYRVEITIDNTMNSTIDNIVLESGQTWKQEVAFTPGKTGRNQEVVFLLFKGSETVPWLDPLRLWIDVDGL